MEAVNTFIVMATGDTGNTLNWVADLNFIAVT